jgi:type IV pilus assembly protein PilF
LLTVALLGACGAAPPSREVRTDSDQTESDRRANVRFELAQGYFASGQFNTALDELKQALISKPELREAINLRALIYAAMGETQLADESFKRSLGLFPNDADALHNYGWFLCQQQQWPAADAQFDLAIAQPSYRAPQRSLLAKGVCEARSGRMKAAERSLARAFELDAGNPAIATNLAEVLYRNGELERARFYAKRVLAVPEQTNAQSLWLALRIERKLGNTVAADDLAEQLRKRWRNSPETQALDAGRFNE